MSIATDSAGNRYIHVCQCRHHSSCDFTAEGLSAIVEKCTPCGGCDSVQSYRYNPNTFTLEEIPEPFKTALVEEYEGSTYLQNFERYKEQIAPKL